VPTLLAEAANLGQAVTGPELAIAPWAVVVVAGLVTLVVVGTAWALDQDVPAAELSRV
jgi:hypothetical protein